MRIALAQLDRTVGDVARQLRGVRPVRAAEAEAAGCDAVLFPEIADVGYVMPAITEHAGPWPGPAYDAVSAAARAITRSPSSAGCRSAAGDCDLQQCRGVRTGRGSLKTKYRKAHLFSPAPVREDRDVRDRR